MYQLKIDPGVTLNSLIYSFEKRAFHVRTMGCFTFFFKALAPQKNQVNFHLNLLESIPRPYPW